MDVWILVFVAQLVRNVLQVDYHLVKYRGIIQDLRKEVCVRVCVRVYVCACVRVLVCVHRTSGGRGEGGVIPVLSHDQPHLLLQISELKMQVGHSSPTQETFDPTEANRYVWNSIIV